MGIRRKLLAFLLIASLFPGLVAAGQTLVYSDHEPLAGMRTRFIKDVFFAAIEKESQGRLVVEDHWNGELSRSYDALRTVGKDGAVDMAVVVPEYTPAQLPLHQIFKSFPVGPSGSRQVEFFHQVAAEIPELREEIEKEEVVTLLFATGYPVAFFGTRPLAGLGDVKGKWRTASFWHQGFLRNTGAEPVTMPWGGGVRDALRTGALDGLMVNIDSGVEIEAEQVAPNVLLSQELWLGHVYLVVMNRKVWNALGEEDREAVHRAAETAPRSLGQVMDDSFAAALEQLREGGATFRVPASHEVEEWKNATRYRELQNAWVTEQEGKGVRDAGRILREIEAIHAQAME